MAPKEPEKTGTMKLSKHSQESRVRKLAAWRGHRVMKSRQAYHSNNLGQFQLIKSYDNSVVLGLNFDASLDTIEAYLRDLHR